MLNNIIIECLGYNIKHTSTHRSTDRAVQVIDINVPAYTSAIIG